MKAKYENRTVDFYYRDDNSCTLSLACEPHFHRHIEIVYMISGKADAYIDAEHYTVETGDMLIVFPNKVHRFCDIARNNQYKLFIINPTLIPDLEETLLLKSPSDPVIKDVFENERLESLVHLVAGYKEFPNEQKDILMKGYLLSFLAEMLGSLKLTSVKSEDNQAVRALIEYCAQNFTKDLSLSRLESDLHMNKYYISHLFGDKLGVRFNDYINSLRIAESCRRLRMTDDNITNISDAAGFGTSRTFNRAFIKQMGVSPSDYRKKMSGERFYEPSKPPMSNGYTRKCPDETLANDAFCRYEEFDGCC